MPTRRLSALLCLAALAACDDDGPGTPDALSDATDAATDDTADGAVDADASTDSADTLGVDTGDDANDARDGSADASSPDERALVLGVPETGRFALPGLEAEVHVVRTEGSIPHIYAASELDAYRAAGFMMARDRYFEFELARRLALGRLSELLGDLGIGTDLDSRGQGMTYVADRIVAALDEQTAAVFDAYAAGVNAYIDGVKAGELDPPSELALVGPLLGVAEPASVLENVGRRDIAGLAAFVVYQSSYTEDDVKFQAVAEDIAAFDVGEVPDADLRRAGLRRDLWEAPQGVWPTTSVPGFGINGGADAKRIDAVPARAVRGASVPRSLLARIEEHRSWWNPNVFRRLDDDWGSNVWAVSGANTADGASLLAGDGHLSLGIPTLFWQAGLDTVVFGGGTVRERGLYLPGFPFLGVGTNGSVAWSQTYPTTDVMDWYAEQIRLDANGVPDAAYFDDEWVPLTRIDETYVVAGTLGGEDTTVVWPRWETADGRWLQTIEGDEVDEDFEPADGQTLVQMRGTFVVPRDVDGDGVISALSMDYTAFDIANMGGAVRALGATDDAAAFRAATQRFIGYAQNLIAADADGGITFSFHSALPCRGYLAREGDGWADGADPNQVLDGTRYGGFAIPTDADGAPVSDDSDPYRCVIPFDDWPSGLRPESGYLQNANNDPAGLTLDGALGNDQWHLGGPWSLAFRAKRIDEVLAEQAAAGTASLESMQALQGDHTSMVAARVGAGAIAAIADARVWNESGSEAGWQRRAAETYAAHAERLDEVEARIGAWLARGANAASGVETFYHTPSAADRDDAAATMLFNAFFRQLRRVAIDDEGFDAIDGLIGTQAATRTLVWMLDGRGPGNPLGLASWSPDREESVFWDDVDTGAVERSPEIILEAWRRALDDLTGAPGRGGGGGFGTDDMAQWLWGLKHQVRFESILVGFASGNPLIDVLAADFSITTDRLPLAPSFEIGDPRAALDHFPRPGDLYSVDAARPSLNGDYTYAQGPVMRMVVALYPDGRVEGANILPGGQSGLTDSPHFDDQAAVWLGNETWPLRFAPAQVVEGAVGREVLAP